MRIKKFRADNIKKALQLVRAELGTEAVILKTEEVPKAGITGIVGAREIEVTAAVDYDLADKNMYIKPPKKDMKKKDEEIIKNNTYTPPKPKKETFSSDNIKKEHRTDNSTMFSSLEQEIIDVKLKIEQLKDAIFLNDKVKLEGYYKELFLKLINNDIEEYIASQIVGRIYDELGRSDKKNIDNKLKDITGTLLNLGKGISAKKKNHIVAFIGPTGVGKTTTLAKLAANAVIYQNKNVGLITIDTFRLGAVEQLRTFANVLELPIEVATTPDDIPTILRKFSDKDIVFVDTVGRSPNDLRTLEELHKYLSVLMPDEVYLVLSSTSKVKDIYESVKKFNIYRVDKLIFTKFDETVSFGFLLSIGINVKRPLAYITNGQNIPEDILPADRRFLVNKIIERVI